MNLDIIKETDSINNVNSIVLDTNNITQNCLYDNAISLLALNIRSIRLHFDKLAIFLDSNNFDYDVTVLSETWLYRDFKFTLNGYQTLLNK